MKGSIRRKGKAWSYRVYVSTVDGQNKQIEKGGFKTKKDAELALTKFVNDYEETGIYPENKKITFNEFLTASPHVFVRKDHPLSKNEKLSKIELKEYPKISSNGFSLV